MSVEREGGDRGAFLNRLRARVDRGIPHNLAHPVPPAPDTAPEIRHRALDARPPLADLFVRAAGWVSATVDRVPGPDVPLELLDALVTTRGIRSAVTSEEPEAVRAGEVLAGLGVDVSRYRPDVAAEADLGVTSARAGIAATGSVVIDSALGGGRGASLLPPVHLCVLPADRLLATPGDLFRRHRPEPMPSGMVLITGPSRTGDIEQILTLGVHGPTAVHVVLTGCPPDGG